MSLETISRVQRLNSEDKCETDRISSVELQRNRRILYFSDGTMEVNTDNEETDNVPANNNNVEFRDDFSFMSRVRNGLHQVGSSVLRAVDYIGEELADFFGITSKPNTNSIDYYKQNTSIVNPEEGTNIYNNNRHEAFSSS